MGIYWETDPEIPKSPKIFVSPFYRDDDRRFLLGKAQWSPSGRPVVAQSSLLQVVAASALSSHAAGQVPILAGPWLLGTTPECSWNMFNQRSILFGHHGKS